MRRTDVYVTLVAAVVVVLLVIPATHHAFFGFTDEHYVLGGFVKFFLFASFGDLLSHRLRHGDWRVPGMLAKAFAWGVIGVFVVFAFHIFTAGVTALQAEGVLPFGEVRFFFAFFTSLFMNLFFAPAMMLSHRISDSFIEMRVKKTGKSLKEALEKIDYSAFIRMLFRTIPFFWLPAHTITFLLSPTYRAFFAALLGVMLGLFLNMFKKSA